jgi:hypothetical protein
MNLLPRFALATSVTAIAACTIAPLAAGVNADGSLGDPPPPGYGTLRQEDVSLLLTSGDLQIMVTPLHESVTRVTAPDTQRRLSGLVSAHAPNAVSDGNGLFLVSFFSDQPDVPFIPEEVQFISRGLRVRPQSIIPITPSWGARRVEQRQTEMAVYWFGDGVDLESTLVLAYQFDQSNQWNVILPRIQAERVRARARAGVDGPG